MNIYVLYSTIIANCHYHPCSILYFYTKFSIIFFLISKGPFSLKKNFHACMDRKFSENIFNFKIFSDEKFVSATHAHLKKFSFCEKFFGVKMGLKTVYSPS